MGLRAVGGWVVLLGKRQLSNGFHSANGSQGRGYTPSISGSAFDC